MDVKKIAKEWLTAFIVAILCTMTILFFIQPTTVKETSMQPNIQPDDYLLISKRSYTLFGQEPQRGDVIVFKSDLVDGNGQRKWLIKRVIGVGGDHITIEDGKLYINKRLMPETYTKDHTTTGSVDDVIVPVGKVFVMGDNRKVSIDSRYSDVGFVNEDQIVGKVILRMWPLNSFGLIMNPYKETKVTDVPN